MYSNLEAEKARGNITNAEISKKTGIKYDTLNRKLKGQSPIMLCEAFLIKSNFFPNSDLEYLFEKDVK